MEAKDVMPGLLSALRCGKSGDLDNCDEATVYPQPHEKYSFPPYHGVKNINETPPSYVLPLMTSPS